MELTELVRVQVYSPERLKFTFGKILCRCRLQCYFVILPNLASSGNSTYKGEKFESCYKVSPVGNATELDNIPSSDTTGKVYCNVDLMFYIFDTSILLEINLWYTSESHRMLIQS